MLMLPFKPVILWTDALLFILLIAVMLCALYIVRHEHLRASWRSVAHNKRAMVAAVILLAYVGIGFLDSLHFQTRLPATGTNNEVQYSNKVNSVLDIILKPMQDRSEKTYSAPFALTGFSKESTTDDGIAANRDYPRLQYAGAHLSDPSKQRMRDIWQTTLTAIGKGVLLTLILFTVFLSIYAIKRRCHLLVAGRQILLGKTSVPWNLMGLTIMGLIVLGTVCWSLGENYYILGTDKIGSDVFVAGVKSVRTGLIIGTVTTLVMLPFAVSLGMMAGYFRGFIDDVIQYLYTTLSSIPGILLIAASVLMLQVFMSNHPDLFDQLAKRIDARLLALCLILGITSWTGLCRIIRAETLKLRELEYVQAAIALNVRHLQILKTHILPNVMHLVLIAMALDFSGLVLAEAVLSYVGIGVDPAANSWGNMINQSRLELARDPVVWWSLIGAFSMMFMLVLSANLLADAIRDAFDPRLQH